MCWALLKYCTAEQNRTNKLHLLYKKGRSWNSVGAVAENTARCCNQQIKHIYLIVMLSGEVPGEIWGGKYCVGLKAGRSLTNASSPQVKSI